jgi:hypothetical protein
MSEKKQHDLNEKDLKRVQGGTGSLGDPAGSKGGGGQTRPDTTAPSGGGGVDVNEG